MFSVDIAITRSSLSTDGVMQLQDVRELIYLSIMLQQNIVALDVWPLCLAQKQPGITIYLVWDAVTAFTNNISPPTM